MKLVRESEIMDENSAFLDAFRYLHMNIQFKTEDGKGRNLVNSLLLQFAIFLNKSQYFIY